MTKKKISVVIVGYGQLGSRHHSVWKQTKGCQVRAVVAEDSTENTKELENRIGVKVYPTLEQALDREGNGIDVVDICTSPNKHSKLAIFSMQLGKNVLVERPIAPSLEQAEEMDSAASKNNVKLMVGYVVRFYPEYAKIKQMITEGCIGEPVISHAYRVGPTADWNSRSIKEKVGGGMAFDLAIDDIDFLQWCYDDEVISVYAKIQKLIHDRFSSSDFALINLRFSKGGIAVVGSHYSVPSSIPFTSKLEIDGTKGALALAGESSNSVRVYRDDVLSSYRPYSFHLQTSERLLPLEPFLAEISRFVNCIKNNEIPLVSAKVARRNLGVALAAVKSSTTNKEVKLSR